MAGYSDPLLDNVRTDYAQVDEDSMYPKRIPNFYRDRAITVYGRFDARDPGHLTMRLTGRGHDGQKEIIFKQALDEAASGTADIARGWAFQKIYYLIGEITRVGEKPELLAEVRALGNKYNVSTAYDIR